MRRYRTALGGRRTIGRGYRGCFVHTSEVGSGRVQRRGSPRRWWSYPACGTDRPAAPVPLLWSLRLARSVDAVPQRLKLGSVSLHRVQSGRTHESRAMNARPSRARATASGSLGSCSSTWTTDRRLPPCRASRAACSRTSGMGGGSRTPYSYRKAGSSPSSAG